LKCDQPSSQSKNQTAEIAGRIQPLLTHISQHAAAMGQSRWRQIIGLPLVMLLQLRILWLARMIPHTAR